MDHKGKRWFYYTITVHPNQKLNEPDQYGNFIHVNHYHHHVLKVLNYPDSIIERRQWYLRYLVAKFQVRFPKHKINLTLCPYYPEDSDPVLFKKRQISAAQAQITRVLNLINERRKELSTQLFKDELNDPFLMKCREKLYEKQYKLQQLINS